MSLQKFSLFFISVNMSVFILLGADISNSLASTGASTHSVECGTWGRKVQGQSTDFFAARASRPPDGPFAQGSVHFKVHYSDTLLGSYAAAILQSAEKSYRVLVDTLQFQSPPSDGVNGGDARTDIYVVSAASVSFYGATFWEDPVSNPLYPNAATSFCEIIDTLSTSSLSATTAHEFFHVIQFGYDKGEDSSFLEMISVWAEERVYDEFNSYLSRLPAFFASPQKALMGWTYNNVLWSIFLTENFGDDILVRLLEGCGYVAGGNSINATEDELLLRATDLESEFSRFTLWNYFTGPRDDGSSYSEAYLYPTMLIEKDTECLPLANYVTTRRPNALASNYLTFLGDHATDSLEIELLLNPFARWVVSITRFKALVSATDYYQFYNLTVWNPVKLIVNDWSDCDSLLIITNVVSTSGSNYDYSVSAKHIKAISPQLPYILVLDRDACARPFDGNGDDFGVETGEDYPWAQALKELGVNYMLGDSIPNDLSLCGGLFLIGGFDTYGVNLQTGELQRLMSYMDNGGDIYMESTQIGSWLDPTQGSPDSVEQAFWGYFNCEFAPGNSMSTGNVSQWTSVTTVINPFHFNYDYMGLGDDFAGKLSPYPGADTLIVDQSGEIRGTVNYGPNSSARFCVSLMLGSSKGFDASSTRSGFLRSVLDIFDGIIPALAVNFVNLNVSGDNVRLEGEIAGYNGEKFSMIRRIKGSFFEMAEIPLLTSIVGSSVKFSAVDRPGHGEFEYEIVAHSSQGDRSLWRKSVAVQGPLLSILALSPNPSSNTFRLVLWSDFDTKAELKVFDVSGRLVFSKREALKLGTNRIEWKGVRSGGGGLSSGVYFIRIDTPLARVSSKAILIR